MIRTIFYLILLAAVVAIAVWIADRPGTVEITWLGYIVETPVGIAILAVLAAMALAALLYRFWHAILGAPRAFARSRRNARRERGYRALTTGMVAVAAGDADTARRLARKADDLLGEPPLTMLLSAQAAQLDGDDGAAKRYFEAMLEQRDTEFLGLRGLINIALRNGQPVRALELAGRARRLKPRTPWVLRACFDLQVRLRRWAEAEESLSDAVRIGAIDANDGRHHKAALLLERSRACEAEGRPDRALELAHRAVGLIPEFVPAAAAEARLLAAAGRLKAAIRLIERPWALAPHRALAETYRAILPAEEEPAARVARFERLRRISPDHRESQLALAEIELEAGQWDAARGHLASVEAEQPSRRVYRLLAELEQGEHGDVAAARNWLIKGETAPPDPAWVCEACGAASPDWTALCGHCGAFNTLKWTTPTAAIHLPAPDGGSAASATPATLPAPAPS